MRSNAKCCLVACALVATLPAQSVAQQITTAIVHGEIIDGKGGAPISDGVVLVRGDRIIAVGPAGAVTVPADAHLVDARGKTVLPGLADMHVHLTGGWDGDAADMLGYQRYLNALLYAGVTTVLDLGNVLPYIEQLRQEVSARRIPGPTIHMAGPLIDGADPDWPPLSIAIASSSQIPRYVKQLKRARVDVLKAYAGLSERQLGALVRAAQAESLSVFVDAASRNGTAVIAATGIAAFAHLGTSPITDETVEMMRSRRIDAFT